VYINPVDVMAMVCAPSSPDVTARTLLLRLRLRLLLAALCRALVLLFAVEDADWHRIARVSMMLRWRLRVFRLDFGSDFCLGFRFGVVVVFFFVDVVVVAFFVLLFFTLRISDDALTKDTGSLRDRCQP
jgi:hypothetical protein